MLASVGAATIMALMVAVAGAAMAYTPGDWPGDAGSPAMEGPHPLVICSVLRDRTVCATEPT